MNMEDLFPFGSPTTRSVLEKFLSHNPETTANEKSHRDISTACLLKKAIIICSLKNGMASGSIAENILDSLLIIEQLDRSQGVSIPDTMKAAFCAVAIHCTLSALARSWICYFHAVQRIWKFRIPHLLDSGSTLLIGPDLVRWREDIEAALWDSDASQRLLQINTRSTALQSLRVYLDESFSLMKPALLQLPLPVTLDSPAADQPSAFPPPCIDKEKEILRAKSDASAKLSASNANLEEVEGPSSSKNSFLSTAEVRKVQDSLKSSTADLAAAVTDPLPEALAVAERVAYELKMKNLQDKAVEEHDVLSPSIEPTQYEGLAPNITVEILHDEDMADEHRNKNIVSSSVEPSTKPAQANKNVSNLTMESTQPKAFVPDVAGDILHDETMEDEYSNNGESIPSPSEPSKEPPRTIQEQSSIHQENGENITSPSTEPAQAKDGNQHKQGSIHQNKPSLMDRNITARTYAWEDSVDISSEGTSHSRCHLPSPKRTRVSPLKPYKPKNETRRRKRNMWTVEEEKALLEGVKQCGSDWAWILKSNLDAFNNRTPVDLKDKWRNMRGGR